MEDQHVAAARDVERAKRGDREAMGRLYDRHSAVVLSLCRLRLHHSSTSDAEDCSHETFLRAFQRLDQVEDAAGLRSWLYAIARNVCAEWNRGERRRAYRETEYGRMMTISRSIAATSAVETHSLNGAPGAAVATAEQCALREEQLEQLTRAMCKLPPREQIALHLHYLDPDPIASRDALGLSRSGFYRTLNRARSMLAAMLRDDDGEDRESQQRAISARRKPETE